MLKHIATWNESRDCWEADTTSLFSERPDVYSETWPASGTMRAGVAYLPPMSERRTAGSAFSSLLGTPTSRDWKDGAPADVPVNGLLGRQVWDLLPTPEAKLSESGPDYAGAGREGSGGDDLTTALHRLLPTPTVNDMGAGKTPEQWDDWTAEMQERHGNGNGHGKSLAIEAQLLPTPRATRGGSSTEMAKSLPTPRATDGTKGGPNQRGSSGDLMLPGVRHWGDYQAAIERWAPIVGRPAPEPTRADGRNGARRLNPVFVEWMMGCAEGWVTDPAIWEGIKPSAARNLQLKALGNGVVWQQALAALRLMMSALPDEIATMTTEEIDA